MATSDKLSAPHFGMAFCAVALLVYAGLIVWHGQIPLLGDLPAWNVGSVILANHMRGVPDLYHALKHYPVPNSTILVLPALFMLVCSPAVASNLFLTLYLALAFLSVRSLMRASGADPLMWWIVPCACFLGLNFWLGSFGFLLGIELLLFFLAMLIRREQELRREWCLGLLLTALFFTHMVPYTFALLLLLLFAIQFGRWHVVRQAVPSLLMLLWYIVGRFTSGNVDSSAAPTNTTHLYGPTFWAMKANAFLKSFGLVNPVALDQHHSAAHALLGTAGFIAVMLINLLLCVALITLLIRSSVAVATTRPYVWLAATVALPAYLLVPMTLLGIADPGSRILQSAVFPLLLVMPAAARSRRTLLVIAGCSACLMCVNAMYFCRLPWSMNVPQTSTRLPDKVETLAKAPYTDLEVFRAALARGDLRVPIFETSVLRNARD